MKYLCIDPGTSHTGIAVSDEGALTTPLATLSTPTKDTLLLKVKNQINLYQPDLIVVGQPSSGPISSLSIWLLEELKKLDLNVDSANEDLSTKTAQKHLYESSLSVKKRHLKEHSAAAAVILQSYLDTLVE